MVYAVPVCFTEYSMNHCVLWCDRIQLTVMHHNENVNRPVIINKDGTVRQQIVRKKITKQQQTSIPLRVPPTYGEFRLSKFCIGIIFQHVHGHNNSKWAMGKDQRISSHPKETSLVIATLCIPHLRGLIII